MYPTVAATALLRPGSAQDAGASGEGQGGPDPQSESEAAFLAILGPPGAASTPSAGTPLADRLALRLAKVQTAVTLPEMLAAAGLTTGAGALAENESAVAELPVPELPVAELPPPVVQENAIGESETLMPPPAAAAPALAIVTAPVPASIAPARAAGSEALAGVAPLPPVEAPLVNPSAATSRRPAGIDAAAGAAAPAADASSLSKASAATPAPAETSPAVPGESAKPQSPRAADAVPAPSAPAPVAPAPAPVAPAPAPVAPAPAPVASAPAPVAPTPAPVAPAPVAQAPAANNAAATPRAHADTLAVRPEPLLSEPQAAAAPAETVAARTASAARPGPLVPETGHIPAPPPTPAANNAAATPRAHADTLAVRPEPLPSEPQAAAAPAETVAARTASVARPGPLVPETGHIPAPPIREQPAAPPRSAIPAVSATPAMPAAEAVSAGVAETAPSTLAATADASLEPFGLVQGPDRSALHAGERLAALLPADMPRGLGLQIAEAAARFPDRPVELTLSPEELGRVRMTLTATESGLSLAVQADRPETLELLRRNIDQLAQDFRSLGFENLAFSFANRDDRTDAPSRDQIADERLEPATADNQTAQPNRLRASALADGASLDLRL